jgi:hypothetical protein
LFSETASDIDLAHMQLLGRVHYDMAVRYSQTGFVSLSIVRAGVPVACAAARQESARFLKDAGDSLLRLVVVLEDDGVLAQMLCTVLRGINVLIRKPKVVIASHVDAAISIAAPLVQSVSQEHDSAELEWALTNFREGYGGSVGVTAEVG